MAEVKVVTVDLGGQAGGDIQLGKGATVSEFVCNCAPNRNLAIGSPATITNGLGSTAIGTCSVAYNPEATAIGAYSCAFDGSVAVGNRATATTRATVIGHGAKAKPCHADAVVMASGSFIGACECVCLPDSPLAQHQNAIMIYGDTGAQFGRFILKVGGCEVSLSRDQVMRLFRSALQ